MTPSPGASIILNPLTTRALLLVLLWTSSNFPMILRGADFIDWKNLQNPALLPRTQPIPI